MPMTDHDQDEQFYRDTESIAFPKLDDRQISQLASLGQRRTLRHGDILFNRWNNLKTVLIKPVRHEMVMPILRPQ
jgi:hypothetical protein